MMAALQNLAQLEGIALEYEDIWSQPHRAPPSALVDLLQAMHVPAHDAGAVDAALQAHEAARWRQALPPAWTALQAALPLRLPQALDDATLEWRLVEESGAQ